MWTPNNGKITNFTCTGYNFVQELHGDGMDRRATFSEWSASQSIRADDIMFSDEACFHLKGYWKRHYIVYWAQDNPHVAVDTRHRNNPWITAWRTIPLFRGQYSWKNAKHISGFDVLLTVHLSIFVSVFSQLDAQNLFHNKFYFMAVHVSNTCANHQEVKIALHRLWYHHTDTSNFRPLTCFNVMIPEAV